MMKIQYNVLVKKIYEMVDLELELDTKEGREVAKALTCALTEFHPEVIAAKKRHDEAMKCSNILLM